MKASALAVVVLALGAQAVPPPPGSTPPPPAATGAISGVVLDDATGAPIADAIVYLAAGRVPAGAQPRQFTDARGRFVFPGLTPSPSYAVSASKPGYLTGGYAEEPSHGTRNGLIPLQEGEWISTVRILMVRTSAIAGVVMDEAGDPVVGVTVRLYGRIVIQGRPQLAAGPATTTDDRGAYRIGGLAPGRYIVSVPFTQTAVPTNTALGNPETQPPSLEITPATRLVLSRVQLPPTSRDGVARAYPFTFAPSTSVAAQATVIDLKSGEERTGQDVRLNPVETGRVSGVVQGPVERLTLRLLAEGLEGLGHGGETATAFVSSDGRFEFVNVPAGNYTLDAPLTINEFMLSEGIRGALPSRAAPPPGTQGFSMNSSDVAGTPPGVRLVGNDFRSGVPSFAARTTVAVRGGESTSVTLQLRPLGKMTARIVVDPDSPKPTDGSPPSLPSLRLEPAGADPTLGFLNARFDSNAPRDINVIEGLRAAPYVLRISTPGTWMIKSAIWRGRDYLDEPFDGAANQEFDDVMVTVTRAVPVVSGVVRDERGRPGDAAAVIIFPVQPAWWTNYGFSPSRIRMVRTATTGAYRLTAPPGDYYLITVPPPQATAWQDPAFLEKAVSGAMRVTLEWGGTASRDLVIK